MRTKFLKKMQIDFVDSGIRHILSYEIFSSGEMYGRVKNNTFDIELENDDREAAIRLLDKFYIPGSDPTGEYDDVSFTDLNPAVVVEFD